MELGSIVEIIDRQKILCTVVLEVKKKRLRLLTENTREVNLSAGRLWYTGDSRLDLTMGRNRLVDALKTMAARRRSLSKNVDIQELWEVLNTEQEWIDLPTMAALCFPENLTDDHIAAVIRAFFSDRVYFKFNTDRFFPHSEEQVDLIIAKNKQTEERARIIDEGGEWLKKINAQDETKGSDLSAPGFAKIIDILKSFYLHEKDSEHLAMGKAILSKAGLGSPDKLFPVFVKLGEFDEDENVEIQRYGISVDFPPDIIQQADELSTTANGYLTDPQRRDLTDLSIMTIDGQGTLDFDDAISFEDHDGHFRVGVHIADVGHFVQKGSLLDQASAERGSSIYTPDQRIPMLPAGLTEGLCSLKAGEPRPAISIMMDITTNADVLNCDIFPSLIEVKHQLTYYEVNLSANENREIDILRTIATNFRNKRLSSGAVQITLPDIHIWINDNGERVVSRINRESPGRMLVSEFMILANWQMSRFLSDQEVPAVYRSQPQPRERLYQGDEGTLFQHYMQRRLLNRFVLNTKPEPHSGLGLDAYITATSPIRKYFDLVTQRQIRSVLGLESPYSEGEMDQIIQMLKQPLSHVSMIQRTRNRYWLLKYLEAQVGKKADAIILARRRHNYQILLPEYMLESDLPLSSGIELKPEDLIQVTIQQVNARQDRLSVFMG
jgi:exoribonuclease II